MRPPRGDILVLAALPAELRVLRRALAVLPGIRLGTTGMGNARATASAAEQIGGAALVISTGCCGGLAPDLPTGTIVVPRRILQAGGGGVLECPAPEVGWVDAALRALAGAAVTLSDGALITVPEPLCTPEQKRAWHQRCQAVAVDMESAAIAAVAAAHGLPHLVVRAVLDPAEETLPELPLDGAGRLSRERLPGALRPRAMAGIARLALRLGRIMEPLGRGLHALLDGSARDDHR